VNTTPDVFGLLSRIGEDVSGGLVFTTNDEPPQRHVRPIVPMTDDDIAANIATMKSNQDAWIDRDLTNGRFSLAGSHAKFTMARINGDWYQSSITTPSTHIVKPPSERFPEADLIEMATMRLARLSGIPTPEVGLIEVLGERAYLVERFDRDTTSTPTVRIHTEDLSQAFGMTRGQKYGLTARQVINLLHATDSSDTLGYEFVERLSFAVASANMDAHAKNYSLIIRPSGVAFAPAYDQVMTMFWPQLKPVLGMKVGGALRSAQVTSAHWAKLARISGLDEGRVVELAQDVSRRTLEALPHVVHGLPPVIADRFTNIVRWANSGMALEVADV